MVCVHQVNDGDYLTLLDRLEADLEELPSCVQDHFVVGCPPLGLCHATMMLAVSLTDQHTILIQLFCHETNSSYTEEGMVHHD